MLDLTTKMLKLIKIPKVWKTMCKEELHELVCVMLWHANGSVYQCQADYCPEFQ